MFVGLVNFWFCLLESLFSLTYSDRSRSQRILFLSRLVLFEQNTGWSLRHELYALLTPFCDEASVAWGHLVQMHPSSDRYSLCLQIQCEKNNKLLTVSSVRVYFSAQHCFIDSIRLVQNVQWSHYLFFFIRSFEEALKNSSVISTHNELQAYWREIGAWSLSPIVSSRSNRYPIKSYFYLVL